MVALSRGAPLSQRRVTMQATASHAAPRAAAQQPQAASRVLQSRPVRRAALVAVGAAIASFRPDRMLLSLSGGGGGAGGGGWGAGGGGGGNGGGGSWFGTQPALALKDNKDDLFEEEDKGRGPVQERPQASSAEDEQTFLCEAVKAVNLPTGPGIPTQGELFDGLNCKPGALVSRKQLSEDLSTLLSTGLFQNVDANVTPAGKGYNVEFSFREKVWPGMTSFQVEGATILPPGISDEVLAEAKKSKYTTVRVLAAAKNIIEAYYQERGLTFGTISHFDGMETGQVIAHIIEGEITRVSLVYVDKEGQTSPFGSTNPRVVTRELPFRAGQLYNVEDAKKALRDIFQLQLFDNVQVVPKPDEEDPQKVEVDIVLKERPLKTAEVELEWGIAPGEGGRPDLVSLKPGGSVFFEHRNLDGEARQLYGSVSTANFLQPQDDLGFKVEYVRPYCWGDKDPQRTAFKTSAFNSRKLSPVFTGGPLSDEVPGVWVDRAGVKATFTESFSRQSKCTFGAVLEEITTRDESGAVCTAGSKALPSGMLAVDGPPTTQSGNGTDRILFAQGNLTRDTTYFLNGVVIGARDIFQVDQSLFLGTGFPFYNRHQFACTRFIPLRSVGKKSPMPPPVLVLHGRYAGVIGDLASYDAFTLGGPYSCRGYNVGELGAARRVLEAAVELRVPVPKLNTHAYAFYERCSDLGSSKEVDGNPTAYYRRAGGGSSVGAGLKLGAVRGEWVVDNNQGTGALFVRFGERF